MKMVHSINNLNESGVEVLRFAGKWKKTISHIIVAAAFAGSLTLRKRRLRSMRRLRL